MIAMENYSNTNQPNHKTNTIKKLNNTMKNEVKDFCIKYGIAETLFRMILN